MRKILIALAVIPLGGLLSCQNQIDSPVPGAATANSYVEGTVGETYDPVLEDFARTLATSMTDASMRKFVKTEADKAFDGDHDILVQQHVSRGTFEQSLAQAATKRAGTTARTAPFSLQHYVSKQPLLNIAVPVYIDEWQPASYEPLVVVSPTINDESKVKFIKAFDSKGNVHWLDGRVAPEHPVVVVGLNERVRMDATGQMRVRENLVPMGKSSGTDGHYATNNDNDQTIDDGSGNNPGGGSGGGGTPTCYFPVDSWLQIPRMECNDISSVESWDRGLPEICVEAIAVDKDATFNTLKNVGKVKPMPQNPSFRQPGFWNGYGYSPWQCFSVTTLTRWTDDCGDVLNIRFWEEDNGSTNTTIDITLSYGIGLFKAGVTIPLVMGNGDDEIGQTFLYRCKPPQHFFQGTPMQMIQKGDSNFWMFFRSV